MKLGGAVILFMTVSTAYGLRCFTCTLAEPMSCTDTKSCPVILDSCYTVTTGGYVTKGCQSSIACVEPMSCCKGDYCNSAVPVGPSVILLLLSSSIITVFI